jgi:hypothetical protein
VAKAKTPGNPFYSVLVIVGIVFLLTACSYFMMTLQGREASYGRGLQPGDKMAGNGGSPADNAAFSDFMDRYGFTLLMAELGVLAAVTFAAIGTDEYWMRRARTQGDDGAGTITDSEEPSDEGQATRGG